MLKRLLCCASLLFVGLSVQAAPPASNYLHAPLAFDRHGEDFTARGRGYVIDVSGGGARVGVPNRTVTLDFAGGRKPAAVSGPELPGKVNYISGNDPRKWKIGLPTFGRVTYPDVYPGIDVVYYGNQEQLEFDLVVKPGADPNAIRMKVGGAEKLSIDSAGALHIAGGLRIELPKIYQEINGTRRSVSGHYALVKGDEIAFRLDGYDKTRALVVDPTLTYSTYLGGGIGTAAGNSIALDSSLNILVAGFTQDQSFPVVSAAYPYSGINDGFVTKYNPAGTTILYSTYIGGTNNDVLNAIAVDASGNAWAAGLTQSNNFPIVNAVQGTFGGNIDAVLVKLSPLGVPLFSTYLGGSGNDQALGVAVDSNANAYVTGFTNSGNFPTTSGVIQTTHRGDFDVFVEKFNSSATPGRVYSTILGGTNNDEGYAVAADSAGNAYVTGFTDSAAWVPANPAGGAQATITGGQNAFVAKLNSAGTAVSYFTYFGGGTETGYAIALDSLNNVTIGGQTAASGLATSGAAQTTLGGSFDGFVANLNPAGTTFNWVTYVGGNRGDYVKSVALDGTGNVYLAGATASTNLPVVSALQSTIPGTSDTLFQSSNSGGTFSAIDSGITDEVFDVSPDPVTSGTVVVSGAGGIFLSTNNGGSWTQELSGGFGALYLARSSATPTTIYAVAGNGGVRLSTNNGVTWTAPGNVGVGVSGIVADPNNASAAYAFGSSGVYKTSNGGTTWAAANTGLPGSPSPSVGAMTMTSDGALYAALFQGIYKSTNQAGSWSSVNAGLPGLNTLPHTLTASGTTVYLATGNGIFKTTDGGATWVPASPTPNNTGPAEVAAAPGNASILYTATQGGAIYASTDGGATWSSAATGFPKISFVTIEIVVDPLDPTHVFAQILDNAVVMVGKLNSTGSAFTYLTYLGSQGSGPNRSSNASGIATDGAGDAFIFGTVSSDNFLITQDTALQPISNNTAAFLAEISDSATGCAAPVSPLTFVIPATGFGSGAVPGGVPVIQSTGCTWTAASTQSWAVVSGTGTGIGFVNIVSVATNSTGAARTAALTLNGDTYASLTQPDVSCNYTIDQSVYPIAAAGGTVTVVMTTGAGCPWEVTNYYPAGVSTTTPTGTGSATLTFTVAANGGTLERDFFLPIGPQFNDTQIHISQGTLQTISFGALSNMTFGSSTPLSATASSGLTVMFASNTMGVCGVSGTTVTFFGTGTCSITASQNGNATYAAASPVTQSFIVLAAQTISFGAIPAQIAGTAAFPVNASASSGLTVKFASNSTGICTVSGSMVTPVAAGTCSLTASQPGDNVTWGPAASVTVTFTVDTTFGDVSTADESQAFITAIDDMLSRGITSGCTTVPLEYCPTLNVTRGQMAVFIIRSIYGSNNFAYNPTPYFTDATPSSVGSFFPYVQKMHELGITSGCTTITYCPDLNVTRGQMAVFIIRARYGTGFNFDYPSTPLFTDATTASVGSFFKYIQRMKMDNITSGCTKTTYCPDLIVTRDQMAVFMIRGGFNQLLPPTEPIISGAAPATGGLGETINVTLTGVNTNFVQGTTTVTAGAGLTVGTVTVNSLTSLTVQLTIASNATPNPVSLLVTTGAEEAVLPNGFTITSDPAAGAIGYWNGNGTATNSISAMSGSLVSGATYASATSRTLGVPDAQAFSLNGTNSYVQAAAGETGTVGGARTITAWVYPNASSGLGEPILTGGSTLAAGDIFGITDPTGTCSSGGQYQLYIDHGGTACYVSDISLAPGVWSLVAVTFDGSKVVFYIDGVASVTVPAAQMNNYGLATVEIGGNTLGGTSSGASFNGLLSEVQVYNRALTPAEIQGILAP